MIWKNKLSPNILVLTKAVAEHWRGRDWLKNLWQLGRLLWMWCTPPLLYVYKATCCTALFIAQTPQQKTVSIFPMGEAASGYLTARKSHRSFSFHHTASGIVTFSLCLGCFSKVVICCISWAKTVLGSCTGVMRHCAETQACCLWPVTTTALAKKLIDVYWTCFHKGLSPWHDSSFPRQEEHLFCKKNWEKKCKDLHATSSKAVTTNHITFLSAIFERRATILSLQLTPAKHNRKSYSL